MKITVILTDDSGKIFEGEIELKGKPKPIRKLKSGNGETWYKKGSSTEKIITLINEGFFDTNRKLIDIVNELKSKDFHYKSSDLTQPLRKIVRKGILKRTRGLPSNKPKRWTYVKS